MIKMVIMMMGTMMKIDENNDDNVYEYNKDNERGQKVTGANRKNFEPFDIKIKILILKSYTMLGRGFGIIVSQLV